jgi:hypothetical protein
MIIEPSVAQKPGINLYLLKNLAYAGFFDFYELKF